MTNHDLQKSLAYLYEIRYMLNSLNKPHTDLAKQIIRNNEANINLLQKLKHNEIISTGTPNSRNNLS